MHHNTCIQQFTSYNHILFFQFYTGKPYKAENDPDYVPSIFTFTSAISASHEKKVSRWKRMQRRERQNHIQTRKQRIPKSLKYRNDVQSRIQSENTQEDQGTMQVNTDEVVIQPDGECDISLLLLLLQACGLHEKKQQACLINKRK